MSVKVLRKKPEEQKMKPTYDELKERIKMLEKILKPLKRKCSKRSRAQAMLIAAGYPANFQKCKTPTKRSRRQWVTVVDGGLCNGDGRTK
jgi:hypothetical protein